MGQAARRIVGCRLVAGLVSRHNEIRESRISSLPERCDAAAAVQAQNRLRLKYRLLQAFARKFG